MLGTHFAPGPKRGRRGASLIEWLCLTDLPIVFVDQQDADSG